MKNLLYGRKSMWIPLRFNTRLDKERSIGPQFS